jgi:hypothetical protein
MPYAKRSWPRGDLLGSVFGGLMGAEPAAEATQEEALDKGLGMDDLPGALSPAGLALLGARQSGGGATVAAGQALVSVLLGEQANPLQVKTPHAVASIAQVRL